MSQEHDQRAKRRSGEKEKDETGEEAAQAHARPAGKQQQQLARLAETRNTIRNKVTHEYKHTVERSLLIFEQMVAGDQQAQIEVKPDIVGLLTKKLTDKIIDKGKEVMNDALGFGKILGGILSTTYGAIEGTVEKQVAKEEKLTALKAVQHVKASVLQATDQFCAQAGAAVDSIPNHFLIGAAQTLGAVKGAKDDSDENPDAGKIEHGLETWVLEEKMGLPPTGGAVIHDLAKLYYMEFRTEVRSAKPVSEQVDEIKSIGKLPGQAEEKAQGAEKAMNTNKEVETDTNERNRVKAL